jgi:hypothetical protein
VTILDSGIDPDHIDLVGKVDLTNSATFVTSSPCGAADTASFVDRRWHGTFVASQITINNVGIAGVAPLTTVVGVKVFRCDGTGSFADIIAGILYAASLEDVDIINLSLGAWLLKNTPGGGALVSALNAAVNFANSQGKLVVSAAGNDAHNLDRDKSGTSVPAQSGAAISIYATDLSDDLASYSNFGRSGTWVGAPGGDFPIPHGPGPSIRHHRSMLERIARHAVRAGQLPHRNRHELRGALGGRGCGAGRRQGVERRSIEWRPAENDPQQDGCRPWQAGRRHRLQPRPGRRCQRGAVIGHALALAGARVGGGLSLLPTRSHSTVGRRRPKRQVTPEPCAAPGERSRECIATLDPWKATRCDERRSAVRERRLPVAD